MASRLTRRRWLGRMLLAAPGLGGLHATQVEPRWLAVRTHRVNPKPTLRIAHFTDVHYRGDAARLREVVSTVESLRPDLAVFTGDLVEDARYFEPAVDILSRMVCPLYGIAGNHDHWARVDFGIARRGFAATGGAWLKDQTLRAAGGRIRLLALDRLSGQLKPEQGVFNLTLMHYPIWADRLGYKSDLLLAGHSHGGQVRIPFYGALVRPHDVGPYELGWYDTPAGRLYVNPGIGCLRFDVRFNCRPEVTLFEI